MASANTLDFSALQEYVNVHKDELLVKASLGTKTIDYLDIMTNVKHKESIPYLESEVELHKASCDWLPAGSDRIFERYIEVVPLESQKEYCWLDFQNYFMNYQMRIEAGREALPFEQKFAESNMAKIQEAVEDMIWKGDSGLSIDGIIALATGADSALTIAVETETGETITDRIDNIVAAVPMGALKKGVNVFLSYSDFRKYIAENNAACCATRPIVDANSESLKYLGDSRVTLVPVLGLEDTGAIFAFPEDAVIYATDVENSQNRYETWVEKKEHKILFDVLFNFGIAFRWPDEVVYSISE